MKGFYIVTPDLHDFNLDHTWPVKGAVSYSRTHRSGFRDLRVLTAHRKLELSSNEKSATSAGVKSGAVYNTRGGHAMLWLLLCILGAQRVGHAGEQIAHYHFDTNG